MSVLPVSERPIEPPDHRYGRYVTLRARSRLGMYLLGLGSVAGILWLLSTYLFMLEAWGSRGEPKPFSFELWALTTWCVGPVLVAALLVGALILLSR
jgi:hypothetical protein